MKVDAKNLSIIDRALTVEGTLSTSGQLIIKGVVRGTIRGESVVIAREGEVRATVDVVNMTIGGKFEGEITASRDLTILSTGNCSGKVTCKDFIVEAGGVLNAEVTCKRPEIKTPPALPESSASDLSEK